VRRFSSTASATAAQPLDDELNFELTQVLSPTTLGSVSYGATMQLGTLANLAEVLLSDGMRGEERLPTAAVPHALAARLLQWLPWQGTLALTSRAYVDSWGIAARPARRC